MTRTYGPDSVDPSSLLHALGELIAAATDEALAPPSLESKNLHSALPCRVMRFLLVRKGLWPKSVEKFLVQARGPAFLIPEANDPLAYGRELSN